MCECLHRAGARKISLKNGASTPTFSLPIGKFRGQVSVLKCVLLIRFAVCLQSDRVSLQRKTCCQQIVGLNDESFSIAVCIDTIKKSVLGEMLGDAVRLTLCAYRSAMISHYFIAIPHLGQSWYATHGRCVPQSQPDRRSRAAPALAAQ